MKNDSVTLHKYTSWQSALSILSTGLFAFRHPRHFNDPFDSHMGAMTHFDEGLFYETFYEEAKILISNSDSPINKNLNIHMKGLINECREIVGGIGARQVTFLRSPLKTTKHSTAIPEQFLPSYKMQKMLRTRDLEWPPRMFRPPLPPQSSCVEFCY